MALSYLARTVLRRASVPRVAQPARTPRRLFSSSHKVDHNNGARVGATEPFTEEEMYRLQNEFKAECASIVKALEDASNTRMMIGSGLVGLGIGLSTAWYTTYKEKKRAMYLRSLLE